MKFLADSMLGKLAKELRMLGYDTIYYRGKDAHQMIQWARKEGRVILTRSRKLIPMRPEDRIIGVMEDAPLLQLMELIQKGCVSLTAEIYFSRCLVCNALIVQIPRGEAEGKVPDFIWYQQKTFYKCPQCKKIYWQGTHQENMQKRIERLFRGKDHPVEQ